MDMNSRKPMNVEEFVQGMEKLNPTAWQALLRWEESREAAVRCIALADDVYRGCLAGQRASIQMEAGLMVEEGEDRQMLRRMLYVPSGERGQPQPVMEGMVRTLDSLAAACTLVFHHRAIPSACEAARGERLPEAYEDRLALNRACAGFSAVFNVLAAGVFMGYLHEKTVEDGHVPSVVSLERVLGRCGDLTGKITTMMETARHALGDEDSGCEAWDACVDAVEKKGGGEGGVNVNIHDIDLGSVKSRDDLPDEMPEHIKDAVMKIVAEGGGPGTSDFNSERMGPNNN
jgi:hypothetical protein